MIGKTLFGTTALALAAMTSPTSADAYTFKVIHTFAGGSRDGANPMSGLIEDSAGNLYGTTDKGGTGNYGTVFELSPPKSAGVPWTETIIFEFGTSGETNPDGINPETGLIMDSDGALYGATSLTGGVVFKLTPPGAGQSSWASTILYQVDGTTQGKSNRGFNVSGLALGTDGVLYGTTAGGGYYAAGTLFKLIPEITQKGEWTSSILHNFKQNSADGAGPFSPVILDDESNLYGTAGQVVFRYSPSAAGKASGTIVPIYTLPSSGPLYGPTADSSGALYVACGACGSAADGTIVNLTAPTSGGTWSATTIYTFTGGVGDGKYPEAVLSLDTKGNVYGTTQFGGLHNLGTVFKLTPPKSGTGPWARTLLHSATAGSQGSSPGGPVIVDSAGHIFGTMTYGGNKSGPKGSGVVYEIAP